MKPSVIETVGPTTTRISEPDLTAPCPLAQYHGSAYWGASCPRQGSHLPPTWFDHQTRTFFRPEVSGRQAPNGRRRLVSTLDNLRKAAKRWLKALRDGDPSARARFVRAYPGGPEPPTRRDVQHALAREGGHESWVALTKAIAD